MATYNNIAIISEGIGTGDYLLTCLDYKGDVIYKQRGNAGTTIVLPNPPTNARLAFDGWIGNATVNGGAITFVDKDITLSALYHTTSGYIELDIYASNIFNTQLILNDATIDWGDGTTSYSSTSATHLYATEGNYTITIKKTYTAVPDISHYTSSGYGYTNYSIATSLKGVLLPSTITAINSDAFFNCKCLEYINLPNSLQVIGREAFAYCKSLKYIALPNSLTTIWNRAFTDCSALDNVYMQDSITTLGENAFFNCSNLKNIKLSNGLTTINNRTFSGCDALQVLTFPNNITTLGTAAAQGYQGGHIISSMWPSLTRIKMSANLTSISEYAFYIDGDSTGRYGRIGIFDFSESLSIPTIGTGAFGVRYSTIGEWRIVVPDNLYDQWIATSGWTTYADYIIKASDL